MRSYFFVFAAAASLLATSDAALGLKVSSAGQTLDQNNVNDKRGLTDGSETSTPDAGDKNFGLAIMAKLQQIMDSEKAKKPESSRN
ncbi:unnamed protein product [Phytophthora fragariaefolia]|uniref:RxLR effector protein n=1 Tax=Phytophthora fragariaefolia TaxID=1490495 RepID=A0A9W7DC17_9STRA|nr:unnamed protein product [Phytophthora fragariaefolia]